MKRAIVALGLAVAFGAAAEATPRPRWSDWVGDYTGKLAWPGCTTKGEKTATLALDAVDGALSIDLTPAGGGLRPMSLVEDGATWTAQQGDVKLTIVRPQRDAIELTVELGTDCVLRSILRRASTKIAACDQLVAWVRIEAACTKRVAAALEDPAALAKERATWNKPRKARVAEQCATRASKVEASLVDVGCAPDPLPPSMVRAPDCARFVDAARTFQQCPLALPAVKAQALTDAASLLATCGTADDAALRVLSEKCRDAYVRLSRIATHSRCPL